MQANGGREIVVNHVARDVGEPREVAEIRFAGVDSEEMHVLIDRIAEADHETGGGGEEFGAEAEPGGDGGQHVLEQVRRCAVRVECACELEYETGGSTIRGVFFRVAVRLAIGRAVWLAVAVAKTALVERQYG